MEIVSIQLSDDHSQPKYMQLFEKLKDMILNSELKPGEKLPAIRYMSTRLGVNNITVVSSYKHLESNGYVTSRPGSGYYVAKNGPKSPKQEQSSAISTSSSTLLNQGEQMINFAVAAPHSSIIPIDAFKRCINEVLERDGAEAFSYQDSNGYIPLRESIAEIMCNKDQITAKPSNIQIVSGAQQGLDVISKALINPGDYVICEIPTYDGAIAAFKSRGARIVGVNLQEDGMDLIELEKKVRICKPKFIYTQTTYQNPTCICYSAEKLTGILDIACRYGTYIVEDDSMSELCYLQARRQLLKSLDKEDLVIYLKSLSKLMMPGLRVGFIIMPDNMSEQMTNIKRASDISSSGLIQRSLDLFLRSGKWEEHRGYMQEIYKCKYEYMLDKLAQLKSIGATFKKPDGGLCFWVRLPKGLSAQKAYEKCKAMGLLVLPSAVFYENVHRDSDGYLRLSFASVSIEDIKKGMGILTQCLNGL